MKEIVINNENINIDNITNEEIRVKGLIINSNNEILLGYSYNAYQFPGGHLEANETIKECLKREILEETGMNIDTKIMMPLVNIKYVNKKHCDRIYYYIIYTDQKVNLKNTNYTKEEKDGNYTLRYVNMNDIEEVIIDNVNKYPKLKIIAYEMLEAINEYKNKES